MDSGGAGLAVGIRRDGLVVVQRLAREVVESHFVGGLERRAHWGDRAQRLCRAVKNLLGGRLVDSEVMLQNGFNFSAQGRPDKDRISGDRLRRVPLARLHRLPEFFAFFASPFVSVCITWNAARRYPS